jgi:hypothetical protein
VGDLDLSGATPAQLQKKFRDAGLSSQMIDKVVRFYLASLESAGVSFSPHLKVRGSASGAGKGRRASKRANGAARDRSEEQDESFEEGREEPSGHAVGRTRSFSFPIPGEADIRVSVPENLDDPDVWHMVDQTLRTYIKLNAKARNMSQGQESRESE